MRVDWKYGANLKAFWMYASWKCCNNNRKHSNNKALSIDDSHCHNGIKWSFEIVAMRTVEIKACQSRIKLQVEFDVLL